MVPKHCDADYFERWYRGPEAPRGDAELRRDVALALAAAESVLARQVETVLDVGAGEGRWAEVLHELRPGLRYFGIEPSDYALERFGTARNLHRGNFGTLEQHAFDDPFDLVVCADVLHYLSDAEIERGLPVFADLVGGVAFIEICAAEDPTDGDRDHWHARPAAWYRAKLRAAGLVPLGLQLYVHEELVDDLQALDGVPMPA